MGIFVCWVKMENINRVRTEVKEETLLSFQQIVFRIKDENGMDVIV